MIDHNGTIIAVDVQTDWTIEGDDYGDHLNGWWFFLKMINPFAETPKIPTSGDIQTQLAYISSVQQGGVGKPGRFRAGWLGDTLQNDIDLFLHPPVEEYGTLEFSKNKEIQLIGFEYAQKMVSQWISELKTHQRTKLKYILGPEASLSQEEKPSKLPRKTLYRNKNNRNSMSWSRLQSINF